MVQDAIKVFQSDTDLTSATWKISSLTGIYFQDLVNILGNPSVVGSADGKVQYEWIVEYEDCIYTIYDWKTFDAEYTETELDTWSVGGNTKSSLLVGDFIDLIYN